MRRSKLVQFSISGSILVAALIFWAVLRMDLSATVQPSWAESRLAAAWLSAVRGLHPLFHGDYLVNLTNDVELTFSRSFRGAFFLLTRRNVAE